MARLGRWLGWDTPSFFGSPEIARATIMAMDAWTYIPFMMIMILAGLQAIPREVQEAARVCGATSFIFREYRDRSNVGYGTLLAIIYLMLIVVAITLFMKLVDRWMNPRYLQ